MKYPGVNQLNDKIENIEYDKELAIKRQVKYDHTVKLCCFWVGTLSILFLLLVAFAYFFLGTGKFFSVTFSFPKISEWLLSLNTYDIINPEAQLAKLIIGSIFFVVYFILGIVTIVRIVKAFKRYSDLIDLKNKNINHYDETVKIITLTTSVFSSIVQLSLISATTTSNIQPLTFAIIALFALYFVVCKIFISLYCNYDIKTNMFDKKGFSFALVKSFSIVIVSAIILLMYLEPFLLQFTGNLASYYRSDKVYGFMEMFEKFFLLWIKWLVAISAIKLLIESLKTDKQFNVSDEVDFYGHKIKSNDEYEREKLKKKSSKLISAPIFLFIIESLLICFDSNFNFILPANFHIKLINLFLPYLAIMLSAIAIKTFNKIKERKPHVKKD